MSSTASPAPEGALTVQRSNWRGLIKTMRSRQWLKSVIVYAALVFDGKLFNPELFLKTTAVFIAFCLLSSSVYILNDLVDMEKDRQHPRKRTRPLASGRLDPRFAAVAAVILGLVSLGGAFAINPWAGVVVVQGENFSPWLYICVTLLALFLGFGKRRQEIVLLEGGAHHHRASLAEYNLPLLDQIITIITTSTLIAYTFYSFDAATALAHNKMLVTVPFVFYFIARYLYLVHVKGLGGAPDELLLDDKPLLINSALWALAVVVLIYVWK